MKRLWDKTRVVKLNEQHPTLLLHEEQHLPRLLVYPMLLLGAIAVAGFAGPDSDAGRVALGATFVAAGMVFVEVFAVFIEVDATRVRFVVRPFYSHSIPLAAIERFELATRVPLNNPPYRPAFGDSIFSYRYGYRRMWVEPTPGLELTMHDGTRYFISSAHPNHLAEAIARAKQGAAA